MLVFNQQIDKLLLDGIINPDKYFSIYPYPLNLLLREELISLNIELNEEELSKRITYSSSDNSTRWFLDGNTCLVESSFSSTIRGSKPKYSKPYRESMYSDINIKNTEKKDWVFYKDVDIYAYRQATICDYIENTFFILSKYMDVNSKNLVDKLLTYHKRQKKQIENILDEVIIEDRKSFYYEQMFSRIGFDFQKPDLLSFWIMMAISYLRARSRFELLLTYNSLENSKYLFNEYEEYNSNMWLQFHKDATDTASLIFDYLFLNYKKEDVREKIDNIINIEALLMKEIKNYNL